MERVNKYSSPSPGRGHAALKQARKSVSTSLSLHWSRHQRVLTLCPDPQDVEQSLQDVQLSAPQSPTTGSTTLSDNESEFET